MSVLGVYAFLAETSREVMVFEILEHLLYINKFDYIQIIEMYRYFSSGTVNGRITFSTPRK